MIERLRSYDRIPSNDADLKYIAQPLKEAVEEYTKIIINNTREAVNTGIERTLAELKKQGMGKSRADDMLFFLNGSIKTPNVDINGIKFDDFSQDISDRLREQTFVASEQTIDRMTGNVMDNLKDSYEQGFGIDKAAGNLDSVFENMKGYELERVARTEINGAQNKGAEATMVELGIQYDKWRTAGDERVRGLEPGDVADHTKLDGQISKVGGTFSNGLTRPGDRTGDIAEWINCRCVLVPYLMPEGYMAPAMEYFYESDLIKVEKPKEIKKPVPKPKPKAPKPKPRRIPKPKAEQIERRRVGHIDDKKIEKLTDKERGKIIKDYYKESGITLPEKEAENIYKSLSEFTGSDYGEVREIQKIGIDKFLKKNPHIKKSVAKQYLKEADKIDDFLKNAPKYPEESIYRGLNIEESKIDSIFKKGKIFVDDSVSSFSDKKDLFGGNVYLHTTNKSGVSIKAFSRYPGESEVLMPRNTQFMIKKVVKDTSQGYNRYQVFIEEI